MPKLFEAGSYCKSESHKYEIQQYGQEALNISYNSFIPLAI